MERLASLLIVPKDVFQAAFQEASGGRFDVADVNKGLLGVAEGIGHGTGVEGYTLRIDLAELERLAKAVLPKDLVDPGGRGHACASEI